MQRHEMMAALAGMGLKGMAGAFDEAVTTGLQRKALSCPRSFITKESPPSSGFPMNADFSCWIFG